MKKFVKIHTFNARRFSNPWVARVDKQGKNDFSVEVGRYVGDGKQEGMLYFLNEPVENQVYAYGQKDRRGGHGTINRYCIYKNGKFLNVPAVCLVDAIKHPDSYTAEEISEYL